MIRTSYFIGACFSLVLLTGCASFSKGQVETVTEMPNTSQYTNKPSVYVDLIFLRGHPDKEGITHISQAENVLLEPIKQTLVDSGLFSEVETDQARQSEMDHSMTIKVYNHGNAGAAAVSGFITGFSLFVIPGAATDNYVVEVAIAGKGGETLFDVQNNDAVTTWFGIWLLPFAGNSPMKVVNKTLENQVKDALIKLFESGHLNYSSIEFIFKA